MDEPYTVLKLDEVEPILAAGVRWKPIRRTLGIDAFGINAYTALAAGDHVVEEHTEETLGHQEAYVVVSGRATFTLDGAEVDAPQGAIVYVRDPSVRRSAVAAEAGTTVLAIGGLPGQHAPSAWEWYFEAERYRDPFDPDAALVLLADGREAFPDHAGMLYATACWTALAGRPEEAIAWLDQAIALDPAFAEWARTDDDLQSLRGLPGSPV
jgi:hypothetical protein